MGYETNKAGNPGLMDLVKSLPRALREHGRERRGRARLLDLDDRLLCDLGFTREEARAQVEAVRLWPLWKSVAQGRKRRASCRRGCPKPPTLMDGCCKQG